MKIDLNRIIPFFWTITLWFYLLRSIAEPLKYLFIISFTILVISYTYSFIINFKSSRILKFAFAAKEYQILGLFLISGIILSSQIEVLSIKSLINFLGILILYLIFFEYKDHIKLAKLIRGWIYITIIIGSLGLLKWMNFVFGFNFNLFSKFYEYGSSLVSEYNFYACYFIISIVICFYALHQKIVQRKLVTNQAIILLFILNIALSGSRRGLILLALSGIAAIVVLVAKRKEKNQVVYKNIYHLSLLFGSILLLFIMLIPFRSRIITEQSTQAKVTATLYRYSTIFSPNITYRNLNNKIWSSRYNPENKYWKEYATYNNLAEDYVGDKYRDLKNEYWLSYKQKENSKNLLYNGNFIYGYNFWGTFAPDSIKHEIIKVKYGNALRVSRSNGKGYWPLEYKGRKLIYYEGVTYTYNFKFRVVKGTGVPFMIGWWINEGDGFKNKLPYKIRMIDNEWFEYTASYKFERTQYNPRTFMNSQQANTVVDFAEIELSCDDTLNRPKYLDQFLDIKGHNLLYNSNFKHGLKFWGKASPDSINHELIETSHGTAIRVSRKEGKGYWQLSYLGRKIYYYKDLTYYFRFKYRVVKGEEIPFNIGWWVQEEEQKQHNLYKDVFPLGEGWFECIASYKFDRDYYHRATTFMNSQKANTIIDFADIELICYDTLNRPMYADEKRNEIIVLEESRISQRPDYEEKKLLSKRIIRWKYAKEIWTEKYNWANKLFGRGFDYLEMFGNKFYPGQNRVDYPHNPIISSFLYSGLIGGLFYIYFLVLSFWYYWKYRKRHSLFFVLYLITFTFVFISSDSHFNVPIFAMLSLVPFMTKYIVREKEQQNPA